MTFIDDNCIVFDSEDENKFIYTEIFEKFKTLVDNLLETHLKAIDSNEEQVCCLKHRSVTTRRHMH